MSAQDLIRAWAHDPGRGVLFDFNGTLSDDEAILAAIFTDMFARYGWKLSTADYYSRLAGHSDREIIEMVVEEHIADHPSHDSLITKLLRDRREVYARKVAECSPISAGAAALVDCLAADHVPMGIVTGAQREDVGCVLAASSVGPHLTRIVAEEDVTRGKPDPEGYLRGAELLGLRPEQILVFEDSQPGFTAATRAGMRCVVVTGPAGSAQPITAATICRLDASILDV